MSNSDTRPSDGETPGAFDANTGQGGKAGSPINNERAVYYEYSFKKPYYGGRLKVEKWI